MSILQGMEPSLELVPEETSLIGRVLDDRYQIIDKLGEGGLGMVYRARHVHLGHPVAIKVLHEWNAESMARLRIEAQSASAIDSLHVVKVSDFGQLPDIGGYIAMEYIDGPTLGDAVDEGPLSWQRALHIAKQLATAMHACHWAGVIHRDLKPNNILLTKQDRQDDFVKVLDFGIAKIAAADERLTITGIAIGTPEYMSPEQCMGGQIDHRTDIYALGAVIYELVVGEPPFCAGSLMEVVHMQLKAEPTPPSQLGVLLPVDFEAAILRCLAKEPEDRFESMETMGQALSEIRPDVMVTPSRVSMPSVSGAFVGGGASERPAGGLKKTAYLPVTEPAFDVLRKGESEPIASSGGQLEAERSDSIAPGSTLPPVMPPSRSRAPIVAALVVAALVSTSAAYLLSASEGAQEQEQAEPEAILVNRASPDPAAAQFPAESQARAEIQGRSGQTSETDHQNIGRSASVDAVDGQVMIRSTPVGAEIFMDGRLIGTTPTPIPRPLGEERVSIELRAEGFVPKEVWLSALSATELTVRLDESHSPRRHQRPHAPSSPGTASPNREEPETRSQRQFLNPWQ